MFKNLSILALFATLAANTAMALEPVTITPIQDQTINLGAEVSVPVYIALQDKQDLQELKLSVDTTALAQSVDPGHDIAIRLNTRFLSVTPASVTAQLVITTRTSAPSFKGASFRIVAHTRNTDAFVNVKLSVNSVYVVDVLNGTDGNTFGFSSPTETSYFRPHAEGLAVSFRNLSDQSMVIHGEDAIPHQDTGSPLTPAIVDAAGNRTVSAQGTYTIPAILPADGADLPGMYTIHNVYKPERHVVFNASSNH